MGSGFKVIVHEISINISTTDFSNLFRKYGDVTTVYINSRNVYEGKRSGYVVYRNKRECCKAIKELNAQPPFYLSLEPTFSLNESTDNHLLREHDDYRLPPETSDLGGDHHSFSISNKTLSENFQSNAIISNYSLSSCIEIGKKIRKGDNARVEPTEKFSLSGQTIGKTEKVVEKHSLTGNVSVMPCGRSYGNKIDKIGKRQVELQKTERCPQEISNITDSHDILREELNESLESKKREFGNEGINFAKVEGFIKDKTVERKCVQSISEIKLTGEVKEQHEARGNIVNKEVNDGNLEERKNVITLLKSSQEKITAQVIIGSNFKKSTDNLEVVLNTKDASRCNTWELLSDNPDTEIVNYDLCTQQKKLLTDKFTKVTIYHCIGPGDYWVHCSNDLEDLRLITKLLLTRTVSGVPCKPSVADYYVVKLEKASFRCKVLSLEEPKAKVQLIDFGISINCEITDLSELPPLIKNYYAQAIHVKLDSWTPEKYFILGKGDTLNLKGIEVDNETTKVQVDGVLYSEITVFPESFVSSTHAEIDDDNDKSSAENLENVQWPPSVLNVLKLGQEAACTVLSIQKDEDECKDEMILAVGSDSTSKDMDRILVAFPKFCRELPEDPSFRPSVGELIAAYYEAYELWVRAVLLSQGFNHWLVACCDFGIVVEVKKIQIIPADHNYRIIPCLAVRCKITISWLPRDYLFSEEWIKENSMLWMKVSKKECKHLECKLGLVKESPLCVVSMELWVPQTDKPLICKFSPKPENLKYICLSSGKIVRIVSYFMSLVLFVQPWNEESQQQIENLQKNINNFVGKSEPLKDVPAVGKIYIGYFSGDMKYYRVLVTKVKDKEHISVTYIDFGNSEEVSLSNLYNISSELEEVPCFAVKIGLEKKFEKLLNKDALTLLSCLTADKVALKLIISDGNLKKCDLVMKNGSLLSDILKRLADPSAEIK